MVFDIYKRGQGKYTRIWSSFGVAIVIAVGCLGLYRKLEAASWWSARTTLWIATMVPVGLFVVLALTIFWLVNKPAVADFMISAEGEMKKVSWSSKQEITVSTFVVIVVVVVMSALLGTTDLGFSAIFDWLLS